MPLQGEKMIVGDPEPTEAELVAMQQTIEEPQQQQQQQQLQQQQQHQQQHQQPIRQIVQTASGKQQTLYSCK